MSRKAGNFYLLFWIFLIGGIAGFCIETIWCYFAFHGFSSRTSNLFFPFSIVWAIGAVILTIYMRNNHDKWLVVLFLKGCILSGIFEFVCGYIGEMVLGVTFWDYSSLYLHIGRYVNLLICLLWGVLCIIWKKFIYQFLERQVLKITSKKIGRIITMILIIFMVITNLISGMALVRMNERKERKAAKNKIEEILDTDYPDDVIALYFPKMKYINQ